MSRIWAKVYHKNGDWNHCWFRIETDGSRHLIVSTHQNRWRICISELGQRLVKTKLLYEPMPNQFDYCEQTLEEFLLKKHTFLFKYCVWKYRPWKCRNLFSEHCVQRNGAATAILTRATVGHWMLCSHHLKAYNVLRAFLHSYWDPTEISCVHFPSSIRGQMGARSQSIWENVLYEEVLYVPHLPLT